MENSIQTHIAALRSALADSKLEVTIGDATVKYKSNADIIKALEKLEASYAISQNGESGSRHRAVAGSRYI